MEQESESGDEAGGVPMEIRKRGGHSAKTSCGKGRLCRTHEATEGGHAYFRARPGRMIGILTTLMMMPPPSETWEARRVSSHGRRLKAVNVEPGRAIGLRASVSPAPMGRSPGSAWTNAPAADAQSAGPGDSPSLSLRAAGVADEAGSSMPIVKRRLTYVRKVLFGGSRGQPSRRVRARCRRLSLVLAVAPLPCAAHR
jgi:hypothetical protein